MKHWRPQGWENPHRKERKPNRWSGYDSDIPAPLPLEWVVEYNMKEFSVYECGADAMLVSLVKHLTSMGTSGTMQTLYALKTDITYEENK